MRYSPQVVYPDDEPCSAVGRKRHDLLWWTSSRVIAGKKCAKLRERLRACRISDLWKLAIQQSALGNQLNQTQNQGEKRARPVGHRSVEFNFSFVCNKSVYGGWGVSAGRVGRGLWNPRNRTTIGSSTRSERQGSRWWSTWSSDRKQQAAKMHLNLIWRWVNAIQEWLSGYLGAESNNSFKTLIEDQGVGTLHSQCRAADL